MKSINHRTSLKIKKGANAFSNSLREEATARTIALDGGSIGAESAYEARVPRFAQTGITRRQYSGRRNQNGVRVADLVFTRDLSEN